MAYVPDRPTSVAAGCSLYRRFHRFDADRCATARMRLRIPDVLVRLGRLKAVIYTSDKGKRGRPQTYIHFMQRPPCLACDTDGTQLYIVGGRYRITERGIEG
jgi:hypothetical protein